MRVRIVWLAGLALVAIVAAALWLDSASDVDGVSRPETTKDRRELESSDATLPRDEAAAASASSSRVENESPQPTAPSADSVRIRVTSSAGFALTWIFLVDDLGRVLETIGLDEDSSFEFPSTLPNIPYRLAAPGHAAVTLDPSRQPIMLEPHTWITLDDVPADVGLSGADYTKVAIDAPTVGCVRRMPGRVDLAFAPYPNERRRVEFDVDLHDGWRATVRCALREGARHQFSLRHPDAGTQMPLIIDVVDASGPVANAEVQLTIMTLFEGKVYSYTDDVSFLLSPVAGGPRVGRSNANGLVTFEHIPFGATMRVASTMDDGRFGHIPLCAHDGTRKTLRLVSPPHVRGRVVAPPGLLSDQRVMLYLNWPYVIEGNASNMSVEHAVRCAPDGSFDERLRPPMPWLESDCTFVVERIEIAGFESAPIARTFGAEGGDVGDVILIPMQPLLVLERFDPVAMGVTTSPGSQKGLLHHGEKLDSKTMIFELRKLANGDIAAFGFEPNKNLKTQSYHGDFAFMYLYCDGISKSCYFRRTQRGTYAPVPTQTITLTLDAQPTKSTDDLQISVRWPRVDVLANRVESLSMDALDGPREWTVTVPADARIGVDRYAKDANPKKTSPLASWTSSGNEHPVRLVVP